jgi:nucleotide-binding universal stress UspA family protein
MKSILTATDTHADSDRALARAVRLASTLGARLTVISVMEDTAEDAALTLRRGLVEGQLGLHAGAEALETEVIVTAGDPVHEIAHASAKASADLVVLGRHHHRKILDGFRATTAEKILQKLTCPALLAVEPPVQAYRRVLAPIAFSDACAASVAAARKLAPDAEMELIHAVQSPYYGAVAAPGVVGDVAHMVDPAPFVAEAKARAKEWMGDGAEQDIAFPTGPLRFVFDARFNEAPADLVCLGTHTKDGAIETIFLGSFTADLLRDPPCDLLIAPPPRAAM